ncbi:hypothetical protein K438DRAFT_1966215 [Mycena galopus ATCC 62051]|nr:hypothetical protein K438DRAFT_1966215 [Mycena galopus ATCC 62051]
MLVYDDPLANVLVDPTETQRIDGILLRCKKEVAAEIHDEERDNGMEASWLGKVNKAVVVTAIDERHAAINGKTTRNETSPATASDITLSAPAATPSLQVIGLPWFATTVFFIFS